MSYELTDLRVFQAIANSGNLSAAAADLYLSPSATSYRLKNLEHALGTPLFTRVAKGMELTPAGEVLLHHVNDLLSSIESMDSDVSRFASGLRGNIRLVANSSSLHGFLIPSLGRFLLANPGINIDLIERASDAIPAAVASQEFDVGVMAGVAESSSVESRAYATDELVIVTPIGHSLAPSGSINFEQALDYHFVCLSRSSSNFKFLSEASQRTGRKLLTRLHVPTFDAVFSLVAAGIGIAMVPRSVVRSSGERGRVEVVAMREAWASRQLTLVTRRDEKMAPLIRSFALSLLDDRSLRSDEQR
ncbi:LysR family transcriptional regulator [Rhodococcus sp. NPDC127530]|uniref:LysR family transcriptional regulator n=1 Tax=unclassified Rhodococcus (in: high G+C Gram-positive bacteria) TaxID=192944 RepID=UPI003634A87C